MREELRKRGRTGGLKGGTCCENNTSIEYVCESADSVSLRREGCCKRY